MVYGCKLWNVGRLAVKEMVNMPVYVQKVPVGKIFDVNRTDKKGEKLEKSAFHLDYNANVVYLQHENSPRRWQETMN